MEDLHLERFNIRTNSLHDANAFMTEPHIHPSEMRVGSTDARVCDIEIHFIFRDFWSLALGFVNLAVRRAAEDGEVVCHFGG